MHCRKWIFVLLYVISSAIAIKVLLVPMPMGSHLDYYAQVSLNLANAGHEPTLYVPSHKRLPAWMSSIVNVVTYEVSGNIPDRDNALFALLEMNALNAIDFLEWVEKSLIHQFESSKNFVDVCSPLWTLEMFEKVSSPGYQVAIVDPIMYFCITVNNYTIPHFSISIPFKEWEDRVLLTSPFRQNGGTESGGKLRVYLKRLFMDAFASYMDLKDLFYKKITESFLGVCLHDQLVSVFKERLPHALETGAPILPKAKSLEPEFQQILQQSKYEVIYVSVGSDLDQMNELWVNKFCTAFNVLKYTVIWRLTDEPPCETGPNVHIRPWLPQNDLLAHPKLVLFITHASYHSVIESLRHEKPMLAFPINMDQPHNAQLLQEKGVVEVLNIHTFTATDLVDAIEHMLSPSAPYKRNIKRVAQSLKPTQETRAWWNIFGL